MTSSSRRTSSPVEIRLGGGRKAVSQTLSGVEMSWQTNPAPDRSGVSWSLSRFRTSGPDTLEVQSTRSPGFVFTQVPLRGDFKAELSCGRKYQASATGLIVPRISGARYSFFASDNQIFGTLASLEAVERWFGDQVPRGIRPLLDGAGARTIHRPRKLPGYLHQALRAAVASKSPLAHWLMNTVGQQIIGFHLDTLCAEEIPCVTPLARSVARDAHALLEEQPETPLSLADVAAQLRVPARRLDEAFRNEYGCSYHAEVTRVRLDAICDALMEGVPIKVAAHRFGYSSASNFSSAFRRRMGLPPRQWLERQARSRR
ncbi:helix-turn-helix domain-containing protein [Ponticoccus sp. (in: a-proteobacteria)]|uniref:helix-turn-helix domain-containing protein n=1 Tax=Ponticoccus sp. (in: a-proteobacteria) TaxID=1925025 RepID=UPI003AB22798